MVNFFIISYVFSYQFSNHGMDRKLVEVDESILSLGKGQNRQNAELNINVPDNDIKTKGDVIPIFTGIGI